MKITLLRHGRPAQPSPRYVTPAALAAWIAAYNEADLDQALPPPAATVEMARAAGLVVCSSLARSQASARALGRTPGVIDATFREFELAYASWPGPPLPAQVWLVFFGLLAMVSKRTSRQAELARARNAAGQLMEFARASGPVLFIGHGLINRAIARELRAAGCQGPARPSTRHWGFSTYTRCDR